MTAVKKHKANLTVLCAMCIALLQLSHAQEVPSDYQEVLKTVGKQGDYKANVLKVNIPRNDLHMKIVDYSVPTPFGFGGWFAMTKGDGGADVLMGDLVLTQEEANPVMSALLDHGLEVDARRRLEAGRLDRIERVQRADRARLHVAGAAAIHPALLDRGREWRRLPHVERAGRHHIAMTLQDQRSSCVQAGCRAHLAAGIVQELA